MMNVHSKYNNMHRNIMVYKLICTNNHEITNISCMLSSSCMWAMQTNHRSMGKDKYRAPCTESFFYLIFLSRSKHILAHGHQPIIGRAEIFEVNYRVGYSCACGAISIGEHNLLVNASFASLAHIRIIKGKIQVVLDCPPQLIIGLEDIGCYGL